jgi:hypothetical protein
MFAFVAAVILFALAIFHPDPVTEHHWFLAALGFWALHFALSIFYPAAFKNWKAR